VKVLVYLEVLLLGHTLVSDISPLKGMSSLRELELSGTRIDGARPLAELEKLEILVLDSIFLRVDFSPIRTLLKFRILRLLADCEDPHFFVGCTNRFARVGDRFDIQVTFPPAKCAPTPTRSRMPQSPRFRSNRLL
jgi:hypothetical protein